MAIVVVALHVHPFEGYLKTTILNLYYLLGNCAVPFFFMCTGYFMAQKTLHIIHEKQLMTIEKYVQKLLFLYLIWTIVYLPITIFDYCSNTSPWWKDCIYFIRDLVVVGEHYNSWILWYLLSGTYGLLFVYFLRKRDVSFEKIVLLGFVLYLFGSVLTQFVQVDGIGIHNIIKKFIGFIVSGRIFTSFFFIPMGMLIAKVASNKWQGVGCICTAILLWCVGGDEMVVINKAIIALGAVGAFVFVINIHLVYIICYKYLRISSMVIYFTHMWIWTVSYGLIYGEKTYGMNMFIITLLFTLGMSVAYIIYKKEKATI